MQDKITDMRPCPPLRFRLGQAARRIGLKSGDLILTGVVLTVAVLMLCIWWGLNSGMQHPQAVVEYPGGRHILSLDEDKEYTFSGHNGTVHIQVTDGKVRFLSSDCPDQICVHSGWLSAVDPLAACVPEGVLLRLEQADTETGTPDAVVG